MKERLVKGRHVLSVIELMDEVQRLETLSELPTRAAELLRKPLYPTTWYQLRAFDDLLQSVHRYAFDGSEAAGQRMGRMLGEANVQDPRSDVEVERVPTGAGSTLAAYWRAHFNFGLVEYGEEPSDGVDGVRIRVTGFPDMSACHGQVIMGWCAEVTEMACGGRAHLRVEERPWMHHGALTFHLTSL